MNLGERAQSGLSADVPLTAGKTTTVDDAQFDWFTFPAATRVRAYFVTTTRPDSQDSLAHRARLP